MNLRPIFFGLFLLSVIACSNESSEVSTNSSVTQTANGHGNNSSVLADHAKVTQQASGLYNQQLAQVKNSSVQQSTTGLLNKQNADVSGQSNVRMFNSGIGKPSTLIIHDKWGKDPQGKPLYRNINVTQSGFFNKQSFCNADNCAERLKR
jgi:hypothetical protein